MEILGFIVSFVVLLYLSILVATSWFAQALFGPIKGLGVLAYVVITSFVAWLWYLIFLHSPFTLVVS